MTEAIRPQYLGTLLALRSILGFGAGAISPLVFGWILDVTNPPDDLPHNWGWAFMTLGAGGAIATICALMLPGTERSRRSARDKR
jgi:MFS family permease